MEMWHVLMARSRLFVCRWALCLSPRLVNSQLLRLKHLGTSQNSGNQTCSSLKTHSQRCQGWFIILGQWRIHCTNIKPSLHIDVTQCVVLYTLTKHVSGSGTIFIRLHHGRVRKNIFDFIFAKAVIIWCGLRTNASKAIFYVV